MLTVVAWIVVFGVLVAVHELGHYLVAKGFGMQVDEYSLGFGPRLLKVSSATTEYSLRLIPLGGYVRLAGMDGEPSGNPDYYPNRPRWQRFLVIFAGPVMNMVLAFILFALLFGPIGVPTATTTIAHLMPHYPAQTAGLQAGDRVLAIDGHPVHSGTALSQAISHHARQMIRVTVARHGRMLTYAVRAKLDTHVKPHQYLIGIQLGMKVVHLGFGKSIATGVAQTVAMTGAWFKALFLLVTGQSRFDLMGPIGIAVTVGQAAHQGWADLFMLAAALSANLGLFNILPVPVLDGSKLWLIIIEGIRRKAMDPERENMIHLVGMAFLLVFVVFVTYHDLVHYLHLG
ncbi:M50 family metallopeptidase [Sulfobacillus harzensis]|uniref:Site-2 protease family protein n=1 Tax=Sulfobacillus harzensis TaxID=2729629 RepID=A0A7Y0L2E5_9FIRM|nr:M50 family metallopeptidase [Sulfobacillus harzensis]NMP21823.1 site-2 protease family protein [Sulfobacillus harzensis]